MASWFEVNKENIKTIGFVLSLATGNYQAYNIGLKLEEYTRAIVALQTRQETNQKDILRLEGKVDKNSAYILELFGERK